MVAFLKWIFRFLFKFYGWKLDRNMPEYGEQAVLIAAPHTSNWDFPYVITCFDQLKIPVRFTIKKEWIKWPYKSTMLKFGAVGIDRSPKVAGEKRRSMVDAMTDLFKEHKNFILTVTPEGTRSKSTHWKTGFYHVAKNAGVPILLSYLDYKTKKAGVGKMIWPSDDMEADMREIMEFYNTQAVGKNPEDFSVDVRYLDTGDKT